MTLRMTRRDMLRHAGVGSAAVLLAACQPKVVEKIVKETVEVEKVVKETVQVEKEVQKVVKETVIVEAKPAEKEPVTLRIHTQSTDPWYGVLKHAWEQNVAGWRSEHPNLTLEFEPVPGWTADFYPKIFAHVAAGTLGDIVWHCPRHRNHVSWGVEYNIVTDLLPFVEALNYDLSQFFPGVVASSTWEGKLYWMPFISEPSVPVIAYNKDLVEKWGLPEPQNDWDYLQLTDFGVQGTRDDVWGYHTGDQGLHPIASTPQYRQFGVQMASDDGRTAFPGESSREGLLTVFQWRYDLIYKYKTMPTPDPTFNPLDVFVSEKVLAYGIWPYAITRLPAVLVKDKFRVGFIYTPLDKKGSKRRNMLNEHVHGVTTASKHPQEAFEYLTFHSSKEACIQSALLTGYGAPVGRPDLYEDPRALKISPGLEMLKPIMEEIEPDFLVANWRGEEFDSALTGVTDAMLLDKVTPQEAVDRVVAACQAVLDKEPA